MMSAVDIRHLPLFYRIRIVQDMDGLENLMPLGPIRDALKLKVCAY